MRGSETRTTLRIGVVIMILLVAACVVGGLGVIGLGVVLKAPADRGLNWVGLVPLASSVLLGYLLSRTNLRVEIAGDSIRERRSFTGMDVERPLDLITRVEPLVSGVGGFTGALMDAMLRTPNRGYLIRFREGRRIALIRGDTRGLDEFMSCLSDRPGPTWSNDRD